MIDTSLLWSVLMCSGLGSGRGGGKKERKKLVLPSLQVTVWMNETDYCWKRSGWIEEGIMNRWKRRAEGGIAFYTHRSTLLPTYLTHRFLVCKGWIKQAHKKK